MIGMSLELLLCLSAKRSYRFFQRHTIKAISIMLHAKFFLFHFFSAYFVHVDFSPSFNRNWIGLRNWEIGCLWSLQKEMDWEIGCWWSFNRKFVSFTMVDYSKMPPFRIFERMKWKSWQTFVSCFNFPSKFYYCKAWMAIFSVFLC